MSRFVVGAFFAFLPVLFACQEAPRPGLAADPLRAEAVAPWGSDTSNIELEQKELLLTDILDGKITPENIAARLAKDAPDLTPEQRKKSSESVTSMLEDLNKTGRVGKVITGPDREMAFAQLYFSERRFVEAATRLSQLLDGQATYPQARNLLARCFFFLGNRDRTISELEVILNNPEQQKNRDEVLDALFLLGAAVVETPGMSRANLEKAKGAWETYAKLAPESPQMEQIKKGMEQLDAGLRGEGPLAQPLVPRTNSDDASGDSGSRGVLGGGNGGPAPAATSTGGPATPARLSSLPANATPRERATATALDAVDARDLKAAETQLSVLISERPTAELLTGMARVFVQTGRISEALRTFGEALKLDVNYVPAWHYNGMAQMMSNAPAEAVKSWEKVKEKDPAYFAKFQLAKRIEVARRME